MILKNLLSSSSLLILRSKVNPATLGHKIKLPLAIDNNLNLCKSVLSAQSVRYKFHDERRMATRNREFRSNWLTRITPEDIDEQMASQLLLSIRARRLLGKRRRGFRLKPIDDKPQMKGIVLKTLIRKPKKPNSANRKCVFVRLTNGKQKYAHVPGEGHNLQEHSAVLVYNRRTKDVPGLRLKCMRGQLDLAHVYKENKKTR